MVRIASAAGAVLGGERPPAGRGGDRGEELRVDRRRPAAEALAAAERDRVDADPRVAAEPRPVLRSDRAEVVRAVGHEHEHALARPLRSELLRARGERDADRRAVLVAARVDRIGGGEPRLEERVVGRERTGEPRPAREEREADAVVAARRREVAHRVRARRQKRVVAEPDGDGHRRRRVEQQRDVDAAALAARSSKRARTAEGRARATINRQRACEPAPALARARGEIVEPARPAPGNRVVGAPPAEHVRRDRRHAPPRRRATDAAARARSRAPSAAARARPALLRAAVAARARELPVVEQREQRRARGVARRDLTARAVARVARSRRQLFTHDFERCRHQPRRARRRRGTASRRASSPRQSTGSAASAHAAGVRARRLRRAIQPTATSARASRRPGERPSTPARRSPPSAAAATRRVGRRVARPSSSTSIRAAPSRSRARRVVPVRFAPRAQREGPSRKWRARRRPARGAASPRRRATPARSPARPARRRRRRRTAAPAAAPHAGFRRDRRRGDDPVADARPRAEADAPRLRSAGRRQRRDDRQQQRGEAHRSRSRCRRHHSASGAAGGPSTVNSIASAPTRRARLATSRRARDAARELGVDARVAEVDHAHRAALGSAKRTAPARGGSAHGPRKRQDEVVARRHLGRSRSQASAPSVIQKTSAGRVRSRKSSRATRCGSERVPAGACASTWRRARARGSCRGAARRCARRGRSRARARSGRPPALRRSRPSRRSPPPRRATVAAPRRAGTTARGRPRRGASARAPLRSA